MDRFYGQLLRNRFPQLSRIRRDDGSTGAKILDCIGNEISNSRSKIFSSSVRVSSSSEFPEAGREKFFYKKIENLNYISNLRNSTIESINCSDPSLTEASSEEEIYASEEENLYAAFVFMKYCGKNIDIAESSIINVLVCLYGIKGFYTVAIFCGFFKRHRGAGFVH